MIWKNLRNPIECAGNHQDYLLIQCFAGRTHRAQKSWCSQLQSTIAVEHEETSAKGNSTWCEVQEKPGIGFQGHSPRIKQEAQGCQQGVGTTGVTHSRLGAQGLIRDRSHRLSMCENSRSPEGKQGYSITHSEPPLYYRESSYLCREPGPSKPWEMS